MEGAAETTYTQAPAIPILLPAASSLYVGDLHPEVTEADLFKHFSAAGDVALVRVCRDANRRVSLGYAYVNFLTSQNAEKALNELNYTVIKGRPCRVMWSQRDATLRKSGVANLFVKNINKSVDLKQLNDLFTPFGAIVSSKIALDHAFKSKGYGFVNFSKQEEADAAIAGLNGLTVAEKELFVGKFIPRDQRPISPPREIPAPISTIPAAQIPAIIYQKPAEQFTNIFIKPIVEPINEDGLKEHFAVFGDIESAHIARHLEGPAAGQTKGYGFVNFHGHDSAVTAVTSMNGKVIQEGSKPISVTRYMKKSEREIEKRKNPQPLVHHNPHHGFGHRGQHHGHNGPRFAGRHGAPHHHHQGHRAQNGINVYVKNIDTALNEEAVKAAFAPFGKVLQVRIMKNEHHISREFGFVTFATPEEAQDAIEKMNGQTIGSRAVVVAVAHRKDHTRRGNNHKGGNFRQGGKRVNGHRRPQRGYPQHPQQVQILAPVVPVAQEQSVEEQVYFVLEGYDAELAGQITGMIIDEYAKNGLHLQELLLDQPKLHSKFVEAKKLLLSLPVVPAAEITATEAIPVAENTTA
eukprot:TRINITY_DN813_c1_g3_i1.p1 TRINITY_DN813_c1_g3~~TRINITY_DN813_c1_g3_i1.p1  ORF type:complete len:639 (-),score=287.71 TRINITY_DN813_c1_g3_i1:209-1942(-)